MSRLSQRDRRAIRIGLLVAAPALLTMLVARPYLEALLETRERLAVEQSLVARERGLLAGTEFVVEQRTRAESEVESLMDRLFAGDPALAAGALARYVAGHARSSDVLLESAEPAGVEPLPGGLLAYRVTIGGVGDIAGVLGLLRRLEEGPRLIRVERLSLDRRDDPGLSAGGGVQLISIGATVAGYGPAAAAPDRGPGE